MIGDLLVISDFFDAATREEILAEMRQAGGGPATVYGREADKGAVEASVRRVARLAIAEETRERVRRKLLDHMRALAEHFAVGLSECEEPQFLRYRTGDFFVAHQDGNTPLIFDDSRARRISVVIFLSPSSVEPVPGTYGGGALVLHGRYPDIELRLPVTAEPGALVAFRAETTHEVTPLLHGERYTIVSWYR
ncbi:MAG TPA: 2OG-Fe(II) oxygenase [Pyrinomonadaceae bacterium]